MGLKLRITRGFGKPNLVEIIDSEIRITPTNCRIFEFIFHCLPTEGNLVQSVKLRCSFRFFLNESADLPEALMMLLAGYIPDGYSLEYNPIADGSEHFEILQVGAEEPWGTYMPAAVRSNSIRTGAYQIEEDISSKGELISLYIQAFKNWDALSGANTDVNF